MIKCHIFKRVTMIAGLVGQFSLQGNPDNKKLRKTGIMVLFRNIGRLNLHDAWHVCCFNFRYLKFRAFGTAGR